MITNHILEDKWRVQRTLSEQAGNDPDKYIALIHQKALETQERYGIQIRYVESDHLDGVTSFQEDDDEQP